MKKLDRIPPRLATKLLRLLLRDELQEEVVGDLRENFDYDLQTRTLFQAKVNYWRQVFLYMRPFAIRSPKFINTFINCIMIGSYVKTSARNVSRNKLFSTINIVGLAVSMSVGLLLIAFVHDLLSYDKFHQNRERIYRVTNVVATGRDHGKFATTSLRAGKLIREKVTGVEEVAILRNDFSGDAIVGGKVLPIKGFWAESSLFNVFTFPMLEGNSATALKDPYSIVLTMSAAKKLFGDESAVGKAIRFDSVDYQVTGIMKDVPFFSHISFEALVSLATVEQIRKNDMDFERMPSNYVYLLLQQNADVSAVQSQLDAIAKEESRSNNPDGYHISKVRFELLPLNQLVVGEQLDRSEGGPSSTGPHVSPVMLWILAALAFVVILSACFNYTNLSMARAMHRFKEVGLRKAIGAERHQVRQQFLAEAIIISLAALVLSCFIFLLLRPQLINLAPEMQRMVKLELTSSMIAAFIFFSVAVGVIAGVMPAIFFSRVSAINALRNVSSVKVFRHMTLRRTLVVVQYTFTLIFITTTAIGYVQYKNILAFDLGFNTESILNIDMQGNKPDALLRELDEMPEVTSLSRSLIVTSIGNAWGGFMKYKDSRDSVLVLTNHVDENYLPLHEHKLIAGGNFISRPTTADAATEVIVNQQVLKRLDIANNDPAKAIGEEITFTSFGIHERKMTIVGVIQDFHYGKVDNLIEPTAFMFWTPGDRAIVNVKIQSDDMVATMNKIEAMWKKIDPVHPLKAEFFDEAIEDAYKEFSTMIKVVGFLSFIAISIASLGLLGMVVFTIETRRKEMSIRKVLGATSGSLTFLLSRGFAMMLGVAALIALPLTYLFFEKVVLTRFPYHESIGVIELFGGLLAVLAVAFIMIASQVIKTAHNNPAEILKSE